jgi:hypothetical protein
MSPAFEPVHSWLAAREGLEMARRDCLESGDSDEEITLYGLAQGEAGVVLMLTPAPDAAALAHKLAVFRDEGVYRLDNIGDIFDALIADAQRLQAG